MNNKKEVSHAYSLDFWGSGGEGRFYIMHCSKTEEDQSTISLAQIINSNCPVEVSL